MGTKFTIRISTNFVDTWTAYDTYPMDLSPPSKDKSDLPKRVNDFPPFVFKIVKNSSFLKHTAFNFAKLIQKVSQVSSL